MGHAASNVDGKSLRPLIFGEVLFDHFPERSVLGGAPFNVAWNLSGFGADPLIVTAVGDDDDGGLVRQRMIDWGMDTEGLQVDAEHPTGSVTVDIRDGQPRFEIVRDQAYDFIQPPTFEIQPDQFALMYHGTLSWRSPQSRSTLAEIIQSDRLPRYVDVNVRKPHFDAAWLADLLPGAAWVKVNDDEMASLTDLTIHSESDVVAGVAWMREQ